MDAAEFSAGGPQLTADTAEHLIKAITNVIRHAQHPEAHLFDNLAARGIVVGLPRVLPTIDFDDELCVDADEIDDVARNRNLAAKLATVEPPASRLLPQQVFRQRPTAP
jgi:hypothetical protein